MKNVCHCPDLSGWEGSLQWVRSRKSGNLPGAVGAHAPWLVDLRDKVRVFFNPEIRGFPQALSSVGGEGVLFRKLALFLLLAGSMSGVAHGGELVPLVAVAPESSHIKSDSIRYFYPPYIVEESRWNEREIDSDLLITVIGPEQLKNTAAMDLSEILNHRAGVVLNRTGGQGSSSFMSIRGSTAQQVQVLMNGSRINAAQGGGVDMSFLSPVDVARIDIIRESNDARWGSESIGGVVNVVTAGRRDERLRIRTLGGSYGARSLFVRGAMGGETRFDVGARVETSDEDYSFDDPRRNGERRRTNAGKSGVSFSGAMETPMGGKRRLNISASSSSDSRGAPGPIEFPTPEAELIDHRLFVQGEFVDSTSLAHFSLGAGLHRLKRWYTNPDPVLWADDRHVNTGVAVTLDAGREIFHGSLIEAGVSMENDLLSSTTDGDQRRRKLSGYMKLNFKSMRGGGDDRPVLSFSPGVRTESTEGYGSRILPSAAARMSLLGSRIVLRGSVGMKYRTPSFDELFWPLSSGAQGDPALRPERSTGGEVSGTAYLMNRNLRLRGTYFLRYLSDLIEWTPGAGGIWRPHNVGLAGEEGMEIEGAWAGRFAGSLPSVSIEITHTLLHATDRGSDPLTRGKQLVRRPLSTSSCVVDVLPADYLRLGMSWSRMGRRYLTATNTKWSEGYSVLDFHTGLSLGEEIRLLFSINNIGGRSYYDVEEFPVPGRIITVAVDFALS